MRKREKKVDRVNYKKGFTLIELSFSIAFIAILSITVTMVIINAIASYRRGIVLNQINTMGMDLADEFRTTIQSSPSRSVVDVCAKLYVDTGATGLYEKCKTDGASNFVSVIRYAKVIIGDGTFNKKTINDAPVFGAFCTGRYSYIWNSGYFFSSDYKVDGVSAAVLKYKNGEDGTTMTESGFRLIKIPDGNRAICISAVNYTPSGNYVVKSANNLSSSTNILGGSNVFDISGEDNDAIFDEIDEPLSSSASSNLVLYDMSAAAPAYNSANNTLLYSMSFILGTVQGGINVRASGNFCATPDEYTIENFDYCAINKFNIAVQANGD
ncbi:type II secretion system protein [Candidatus Saccharibacteria bacterium]|nr:type II secretion system protein [Candidatus Saccharibacteria bacterium]